MSKSKFLAAKYGGKWTYDRVATWHCDDGKRSVSRCCATYDDEGLCPPQYWLYGSGQPELVCFHSNLFGKADA